MIAKVAKLFFAKIQIKKGQKFRLYLTPTFEDKILDSGSEDGGYIASIISFRRNVFIADINQEMLLRGQEKYGFRTVLLDEDSTLPFEDNYFDIVRCNSVIEHVTINKKTAVVTPISKRVCRSCLSATKTICTRNTQGRKELLCPDTQ